MSRPRFFQSHEGTGQRVLRYSILHLIILKILNFIYFGFILIFYNLNYIFKQIYVNFIFKVTSEYEHSKEEKKGIEER